MQDLEKYSSTVQQLALGGWHGVNGPEEFLMEEGEEVGDGRAEGSSAIGDGGQPAASLIPDVDGTDALFLADSVLSTLLENNPVMSE